MIYILLRTPLRSFPKTFLNFWNQLSIPGSKASSCKKEGKKAPTMLEAIPNGTKNLVQNIFKIVLIKLIKAFLKAWVIKSSSNLKHAKVAFRHKPSFSRSLLMLVLIMLSTLLMGRCFTILVFRLLCDVIKIVVQTNHRNVPMHVQKHVIPKMSIIHVFSFSVLQVVWYSTNTESVKIFDYFQFLIQFLCIF